MENGGKLQELLSNGLFAGHYGSVGLAAGDRIPLHGMCMIGRCLWNVVGRRRRSGQTCGCGDGGVAYKYKNSMRGIMANERNAYEGALMEGVVCVCGTERSVSCGCIM